MSDEYDEGTARRQAESDWMFAEQEKQAIREEYEAKLTAMKSVAQGLAEKLAEVRSDLHGSIDMISATLAAFSKEGGETT